MLVRSRFRPCLQILPFLNGWWNGWWLRSRNICMCCKWALHKYVMCSYLDVRPPALNENTWVGTQEYICCFRPLGVLMARMGDSISLRQRPRRTWTETLTPLFDFMSARIVTSHTAESASNQDGRWGVINRGRTISEMSLSVVVGNSESFGGWQSNSIIVPTPSSS